MTTAIAIISAIVGAAPELEPLGKNIIDDITGGVLTAAQGMQKMADALVALAQQQEASAAKDAKSDADTLAQIQAIEAEHPAVEPTAQPVTVEKYVEGIEKAVQDAVEPSKS